MILSNKLAIAMSDRLSSSSGFFRILYQKALAIAELSLKVNDHPPKRSLLKLAQIL
ncbi:MAG: hypothetical protein V7K38_21175 [Nostoc sp.]|uniref:hypothetical protein n=1 Tax=Nostoc sp. TaxID=1180 RepID=UPI002FFA97BF